MVASDYALPSFGTRAPTPPGTSSGPPQLPGKLTPPEDTNAVANAVAEGAVYTTVGIAAQPSDLSGPAVTLSLF